MYEGGYGVEIDYKKALNFYEKAANQGNELAQYKLGCMYEKGLNIEQDYTKAIEFYEKAAENHNDEACYKLGVIYESGYGVEKDYKKAANFYKKVVNSIFPWRKSKYHDIANERLKELEKVTGEKYIEEKSPNDDNMNNLFPWR